MPGLKVTITKEPGKETVEYETDGISKEAAIGYLEVFKANLIADTLKRCTTKDKPMKPATTLAEAAEGRPVAFTRDDTRFTNEMMPREFKYIRKILKKSVAQIAKILYLTKSDIIRFEKQNIDGPCLYHLSPKHATIMRKVFQDSDYYEDSKPRVKAHPSNKGHRTTRTSA